MPVPHTPVAAVGRTLFARRGWEDADPRIQPASKRLSLRKIWGKGSLSQRGFLSPDLGAYPSFVADLVHWPASPRPPSPVATGEGGVTATAAQRRLAQAW